MSPNSGPDPELMFARTPLEPPLILLAVLLAVPDAEGGYAGLPLRSASEPEQAPSSSRQDSAAVIRMARKFFMS